MAFVRSIGMDDSTEASRARRHDRYDIAAPDWQTVLDELAKLDGETRTLLALSGPTDEYWMGVGGGKNTLYVVSITEPDAVWELQSGGAGGPISMFLGGPEVELDRAELATRDDMVRAARVYFETGNRDSSLRWIAVGDSIE